MSNYCSLQELYAIYQKHPQVYIDTRKQLQGAIFVAVGQQDKQGVHRGNQFAEKALESGQAAYAIINDPQLKEKYANDERFLLVKNGEKTLQNLATWHRQQLNAPVLAIAGSNGKTTTKELLHRVLSKQFKTFSTRGNLNNHLGVPLSLLSIDNSYEIIILEVGANHLDETRFLAKIIQPDFGLVTNCGKDHLGEYGSVENIIKANKELYDVLAENGKMAFVCKNDPLLIKMSEAVDNRHIYGDNTDMFATVASSPFLEIKLKESLETVFIKTQLFGKFWLDTLLNAAAIGFYFGLSLTQIKEAIESYEPAALRSQQIAWNNNTVLLDCYNANPSSMEVFLTEIQAGSLNENKVLILGEMLELGDYSPAEHQALVDSIAYAQYDQVLLVGDEFNKINLADQANLTHIATTVAAKNWVLQQGFEQKNIFVKGSRGNKLETIFL